MHPAQKLILAPLKGVGAWTPTKLGPSLLGWWDPSFGVTESGGQVSAWADRIGGAILAQSSGTLKPIYSATSLNGYPGIATDGVDDVMSLVGVPASFPVGSAAGYVMALVSQDRTTADLGGGSLVGYGGTSASGARALYRLRSSGPANRLRIDHGNTNLDDTVGDFTGIHFVEGSFSGTTVGGWFDGSATTPATLTDTINTGTTRVRVGASLNTTPGSFELAVFGHIFITGDLTTDQRQRLEGYALWSCGKQANLPSGHPYKTRRP